MRSYVVKCPSGEYVRRVILPKAQEGLPGRVQSWTDCQRCAAVFTRDEAHEVAHDVGAGNHWAVVRVRRAARGKP